MTLLKSIKKGLGMDKKPIVDFEIDHTKLLQSIPVPHPRDAIVNDPRIFSSTGKAEAWFNGSVTHHDGKNRLLYRVEGQPWFRLARIGSVILDTNFQPIPDTNRLLPLKSKREKWFAEDPRWIHFGTTVIMSYTDSSEMALANFKDDGSIAESWYLERPHKNNPQVPEKNWAFFEHEGELYAVYKIVPHSIIKITGNKASWFTSTDRHIPANRPWWNYGQARGGASPVKHNKVFYHFFHSHTISTLNRWGPVRQYHVGLYVFNAEPPFEVIGYVPTPLFSANLDEEVTKDRPCQHRVVFPCGALRTSRGWWISYGWNDYRLRMRYIDDEEIEERIKLH